MKTFIEKAIRGGYQGKKWGTSGYADLEQTPYLECVLLDPKAWEAVGKVEGWTEEWKIMCFLASQKTSKGKIISQPQHKMHQMIDALCEGKSLESFIKSL